MLPRGLSPLASPIWHVFASQSVYLEFLDFSTFSTISQLGVCRVFNTIGECPETLRTPFKNTQVTGREELKHSNHLNPMFTKPQVNGYA